MKNSQFQLGIREYAALVQAAGPLFGAALIQ